MVKRSIEQEIQNKNFGIKNGNYDLNAVVKNQGSKQRVQRNLGDCWQWETNGQVSKARERTVRPVVFRHTGMAARIQRSSWMIGFLNAETRQFFSWTIFRAYANEKCWFGVNTVLKLNCRQTEIARSVRGRSQRSQWMMWISKHLSICNLGAGLHHPDRFSRIRAKQKTSQETQWSLQKFLEADEKSKVIDTDNSLKSGEACRLHVRLLKKQCAEWKNNLCNVVAMKVGGHILWNVMPICETSQICCPMGRRPMIDVLGHPFTGPIIPFGSLVEYHPITAKDQLRIHQFGKKISPELFHGYALYARGIWKGDVLVADLDELETMHASEIYSERLNAKEVIFPTKSG